MVIGHSSSKAETTTTFTPVTTLKLYLEHFLIQESRAEHGDAIGVNGSMVTPEQRFGDLFFTVDDDGDRLLLHTDGHTVPPGQTEMRSKGQ